MILVRLMRMTSPRLISSPVERKEMLSDEPSVEKKLLLMRIGDILVLGD